MIINDVKYIMKLKFNIDRNAKNTQINIKNNKVHVKYSDKSMNQDSNLRKHTTNENNYITRKGTNENSSTLESHLKKLASRMYLERTDKLAFTNNDEIYRYFDKEEFKKTYNNIEINNKEPKFKIKIYNAPQKIEDILIKYKLIDEYNNSKHGGHLGIREIINKLKQTYIWKKISKMVKKFI